MDYQQGISKPRTGLNFCKPILQTSLSKDPQQNNVQLFVAVFAAFIILLTYEMEAAIYYKNTYS